MLVKALLHAKVECVTLAAYGMKVPYNDLSFLDEMPNKDSEETIRYDIGRNVSQESIPVLTSNYQSSIYPMFGDLGDTDSSVLLKCKPQLIPLDLSH